MNRFIFWVKNCLIENNRECRHYCGTCDYFYMCCCDGLMTDKNDLSGDEIIEKLGSIYIKET